MGEIPMPVRPQPSELWGVMQTPLPSRPRGGRAGFGTDTGTCQRMWHRVNQQGVAGRVTSLSGKKSE